MNKLCFGDIVLLKFPFSDGVNFKRRPALVINQFEDDDIIVCRITSQIYQTKWDVNLEKWKDYGLLLPSVIRVHKIATLKLELIEKRMGRIENSVLMKIKNIISTLPEKE